MSKICKSGRHEYEGKQCKECKKECKSEYDRRMRVENPEKFREKDRRYRIENLEKVEKKIRSWQAEHAEQVKEIQQRWRSENPEYSQRWRSEHPEAVRAYQSHRTTQMKLSDDGSINARSLKALFESQEGKCAYCPEQIEIKTAHIDHIYPVSKDGPHRIGNIAWACKSCNLSKADSLPVGRWKPVALILPIGEGVRDA